MKWYKELNVVETKSVVQIDKCGWDEYRAKCGWDEVIQRD